MFSSGVAGVVETVAVTGLKTCMYAVEEVSVAVSPP